ARDRAADHASHFAHLLESIAQEQRQDGAGVIVAPFDTELFGHWWFEGADFLAATYRALRGKGVRAVMASRHLEAHPPRTALQLAEGSWGANGDHPMWLHDRTARRWQPRRALREGVWIAAPGPRRAARARLM